MAWNEPGGGKDPWGGNRNDQGPPDIDEALKKLKEKFSLFGSGGGSGGGSDGPGGGTPGRLGVVLMVLEVLVLGVVLMPSLPIELQGTL